jgi:hypothetical protein
MKTTLAILFLAGFVFATGAQNVDTNQPARFKVKVVNDSTKGSLGVTTAIAPIPEAISPGTENTDVGTNLGKEYELKWKYIGRSGSKDLYHFSFTRMTKAGALGKTTETKDVLFDGHRAKLFEDDLHIVIIDSPSQKDLDESTPKKAGSQPHA